jgi:hypothetical protein
MRKAAAEIYSANVANNVVGEQCRHLLAPLFADPNEEVRIQAAHAFRDVVKLKTEFQAKLLEGLLSAKQGPRELEVAIRALEDSPVQLPHLVLRVAQACVDAYRNEAGDFSRAAGGISIDLSKIVIRLYTQSDDMEIQSRCLDLMDEMERCHFYGMSDELRKSDR